MFIVRIPKDYQYSPQSRIKMNLRYSLRKTGSYGGDWMSSKLRFLDVKEHNIEAALSKKCNNFNTLLRYVFLDIFHSLGKIDV